MTDGSITVGSPPPVGTGTPRGVRPLRTFGSVVRRPGLVLSAGTVALIVLAAFWPRLFTALDPLEAQPAQLFLPPSGAHWFGTDELGRDLFTRVVYGAGPSLRATLIAVAIAFVVGGGIGLVAGFTGRWVDDLLMRGVDVLLAVPALLLSLALVTALGYGTLKIAIAVGVASVAGFARVMRAEVVRVRHAVFVEAARSCGVRWHTVLRRHVLPHAIGPIMSLATLDLGAAVLAVSSLGFLGYGAPPPAPEWGSLIADGREYLANAWWISTLSGLVVAVGVLATNRIAHALDGERAV